MTLKWDAYRRDAHKTSIFLLMQIWWIHISVRRSMPSLVIGTSNKMPLLFIIIIIIVLHSFCMTVKLPFSVYGKIRQDYLPKIQRPSTADSSDHPKFLITADVNPALASRRMLPIQNNLLQPILQHHLQSSIKPNSLFNIHHGVHWNCHWSLCHKFHCSLCHSLRSNLPHNIHLSFHLKLPISLATQHLLSASWPEYFSCRNQ